MKDAGPIIAAIESLLPVDRRGLASHAKRLSLAFTSKRSELGTDYLSNPDSLSAYLAAFLLPNAVKVMHCLGQTQARGADISVLDIGSGPGTAALAASAFFATKLPDAHVRIAAIEKSRPALETAHALFRKIAPPHHSFESATVDLTERPIAGTLAGQRFDIIIAANVLNELPEDMAPKISAGLVRDFLKEDGSLIIIDPALRETARPLMSLRDRMISEGAASVAAPCLHQKNCPMLAANGRDWCHFYIDWDTPEFLRELDRLSGMDHTHLKMSYFILKSFQGPEFRVPFPGLWRAVSSPLDSKGKRDIVLCGESGALLKMARLNKDTSEANKDFDRVKRGDIVRTPYCKRLAKDAPFVVIHKWSSSG